MASKNPAYINDDYRAWAERSATVVDRRIAVMTKPGVFSHGEPDPSSLLLAEHVRAAAGDVVVGMNCRNGIMGSAIALAGAAGSVILTDRNVVAVEAATRTLAANGVQAADVRLGHGRAALDAGTVADIVAIRIPSDKPSLRQLLNDAFVTLRMGGHCYIAGATREGIKPAARVLGELFGNSDTVATSGGHRIVRATKTDANPGTPSDSERMLTSDEFRETVAMVREKEYAFHARPGVFSWDHIDDASRLLAERMDVRPSDRVLDLGCGYGLLGIVAASIASAGTLTLLDTDIEAVRSATRSAQAAGIANARVLASDVAAAVLDEQFDLVVTNPPFHLGKATDLAVPVQFIHDAWTVLAPGGRLNLVANKTLPYEQAVGFLFGNLTTVHQDNRFKILSAIR